MPESMLQFLFRSLGLFYGLVIPAAALLGFVLTLILVIRGRGPFVGPAMFFAVTMPWWIGLYGMFEGAINSFYVVAQAETAPKPSEIAVGVSTALATPFVGLLLMVPAFLAALLGSSLRSMLGEQPSPPPHAEHAVARRT